MERKKFNDVLCSTIKNKSKDVTNTIFSKLDNFYNVFLQESSIQVEYNEKLSRYVAENAKNMIESESENMYVVTNVTLLGSRTIFEVELSIKP